MTKVKKCKLRGEVPEVYYSKTLDEYILSHSGFRGKFVFHDIALHAKTKRTVIKYWNLLMGG